MNVVLAFVAVANIVVDDFCEDVARCLRTPTLPLAIAALERRDVYVAAMPAGMTVTEITYIFGRASRRRVCAWSRKVGAILGHGASARRGEGRVLAGGNSVGRATGVGLDLGTTAWRGDLGTVAGGVVAGCAGAGRHGRGVVVVFERHAVCRRLRRVLGGVHGRRGWIVSCGGWGDEEGGGEGGVVGKEPRPVPAHRGVGQPRDSLLEEVEVEGGGAATAGRRRGVRSLLHIGHCGWVGDEKVPGGSRSEDPERRQSWCGRG